MVRVSKYCKRKIYNIKIKKIKWGKLIFNVNYRLLGRKLIITILSIVLFELPVL